MMGKKHMYAVTVQWQGNRGTGTSGYKDYERTHEVSAPGKPSIPGSSDPAFRGDPSRYNPEDMLLASVSTCHMLWYLHLASVNKVIVLDYRDDASGTMQEDEDGGGRFVEITLHPVVTLTPESNVETARKVHHDAHEKCFVANSVNFPVNYEPQFIVKSQGCV